MRFASLGEATKATRRGLPRWERHVTAWAPPGGSCPGEAEIEVVGYQGQRLVLAAEARDATLILRPGTSWEHANDDGALVLTMPAAAAIRLGDVPEERVGTYQIDELPGLTIAVQETVVTDQDGNEVGRIG